MLMQHDKSLYGICGATPSKHLELCNKATLALHAHEGKNISATLPYSYKSGTQQQFYSMIM